MNFLEISNRSFSPRDYQTELLSHAYEENIITCLPSKIAKEFIALKLIQELSHELRRKNDRKISIYITTSTSIYNLVYYLTDLKVIDLNDEEEIDWNQVKENYQVILIEAEQFLSALENSSLDLDSVNILVIDDCHYRTRKRDLSIIFLNYYKKAKRKPKVFGLAGALYSASCSTGRLGAEIEYLEGLLDARAETSSDIVTVLRYSPKPIEIIVECSAPIQDDATNYIRNIMHRCVTFIKDHRYDPFEIYSDEYKDELDNMPDPKIEPLKCIEEFLLILNELGVYGADKAAYLLIIQIEKLKVKTPYERHYILLCFIFTAFVQIRSFCDIIFNKEGIENEIDKIKAFSSPKFLRLIEVLEIFKPEKKKSKNIQNTVKEAIPDFNFEEINTMVITAGEKIAKIGDDLEKLKKNIKKINGENDTTSAVKQSRHYRKYRKKNFTHRVRNNNQNQGESEVLCGLIFCESAITAKTLFSLLCEVSRHHPNLSFLNTQYTVDKTVNPITEIKEAEAEHRKQEEVLKKFRMHECNLLITTAVLEEGFDLPKCNLVVRFDQPTSYRSYVQCKGRAKAAAALHVIMVSPKIIETSDEFNHGYICELLKNDKSKENHEESGSQTTSIAKQRSRTTSEADSKLKLNQDDLKSESDIEEQSEDQKSNNTCTDCVLKSSNPSATYEKIEHCSEMIINKLAEYMEIEKTLIKKCANKEPDIAEIPHADQFTNFIKPYQPSEGSQVNLSTAIALLNKYCSKLPSDTFTKLTPIWRCCKVIRNDVTLYQYTIRLPLNCPLKHDIFGVPMITRTLARRVAALAACKILHEIGELDDNLLPIGKEGFKAIEEDWQFFELDKADEELSWNDQDDPRPGTTKRRQYYYKRIASAFTNCRPTESSKKVYLYHIAMTLQCPIPDEQNTRGRKIYSPEDATQSFGILTTKKIPKISAFPIFTRSGEVKVALQLKKSDLVLNKDQLEKINIFINYTFTSVLRLRKYLMLFDPEANENSFFVVPVKKNPEIDVDWDFLNVIKDNANITPQYVSDEVRKTQPFDFNKFKDSVVMPWYRNQDQPQYFYVAEICSHLTPESSFPGENYSTFAEYYHRKYGIEIQNKKQPLLDVDHTSARLNFLTPRYVNRKGVALPTSSEETKRAKRENLEQKQILVPELCTVHPFPASLWRAAVCLPCILYRINALLLADEIRMEVSSDLGLGTLEVTDENFEWPMLNFGWTLADVLKKAREDKNKNVKIEEIEDVKVEKNEEEKEEKVERTANDLLEEANQKAKAEHLLEIGTWSNEMAQNINDEFDDDDDDELGILPRNLEMCSTRNIRYGSPTSWDATYPKQVKTSFNDNFLPSESEDDDFNSDIEDYESNEDIDENDDEYGLKIEFKNDHLAEAFESEEKIKQRQRNFNLFLDKKKEETLNGFDLIEEKLNENINQHEKAFQESLIKSKNAIIESGNLIKADDKISCDIRQVIKNENEFNYDVKITSLIPYTEQNLDSQLELEQLYELNSNYQKTHPDEEFEVVGCGDFFDHFSDSLNTKIDNKKKFIKIIIENDTEKILRTRESSTKSLDYVHEQTFGFDYQPDLNNHPGPSPSILLQALTMSNANDGINLERLETIGDSFLKYAITTYLYCTYENVNEGKLSYLRSKQVSNLNLYRLGKKKILGESMIATKFEPQDNWLPPCYFVPKELEQALIDAKIPICYWNLADLPDIKNLTSKEICDLVKERAKKLELDDSIDEEVNDITPQILAISTTDSKDETHACYIPYNLVTQHSIPDKSIADCVEALIGAYLIDCGPRGALLFMAWLGIRVLPVIKVNAMEKRVPGSTKVFKENSEDKQIVYGYWKAPSSPLIRCIPDTDETLEILLDGFDKFEEELNYKFKDRSYLLQAMTHASYTPNRLTDCYQRLEFLGDAVLDYLITRHLYDDVRLHSPGALTDLRSALVNNTIFASLAVRHGFHKYFRHLSPALNEVIDRFVRIQVENNHCISEEYYLLSEDECNESEDVEVPKALGDIFESIAGAIFLDSNMSLDAVWKVYFRMMEPEIDAFSKCVPKSPIRELLELEPETAKFSKPEKLADGRRVRVTVEVFGKGIFRGIGRNYRIAKCTAAKCALRQLKRNTNKKSLD